MATTGFAHDRPPGARATGYGIGTTGPPEAATLWSSRPLGPAGASVWSTVNDLLRLAGPLVSDSAYLEGGRRRWMLEVSVQLTIPPFMDAWGRSLSLFRWPGGPVWFWCGVCPGFRAFWLLLPDRNSAVCLLVNSDRGAALFRALLPEVMAEFGVTVPPLPTVPAPPQILDLSPYRGRYAWPDREIVVEPDGDGLALSGALTGRLLPIDRGLFRWPEGDPDFPYVTFSAFGSDGRPNLLYHAIWAYPRT
jgi:hypothetical protein